MKNNKISYLVGSALLLALAIVIDVIMTYTPGLNMMQMPMGGKFLNFALLPLLLVGLFYGFKYSIFVSIIYATYQFGIDYLSFISVLIPTLEEWTGEVWGASKLTLLILFDYLLPFLSISISSFFYNKKQKKTNLYKIVLIYISLYIISTTISGIILWSSSIKYAYDEAVANNDFSNTAVKIFKFSKENVWLYSLLYNLTYNITTAISLIFISSVSYDRLIEFKAQDL